MESNREVIITARVDKKIADELKKQAKEKEIRFSSYVRRILINSVEKEQKQNG